MISTVVLDLDGVVRHFDATNVAAVESRYDLATGALIAAAFESELLEFVLTGRISHHEWVHRVGQTVSNVEAAVAWSSDRGAVDDDILEMVDDLRAGGTAVAILSNATDLLDQDLEQLGLVERFDAIFNSADIGFAKPDVRVFQHVCDALGVEPGGVFFTDDSISKLAGAIELGMTTHHFTGVIELRKALVDAGVC